MCKSGTDFREFTEITVDFSSGKLHVDACRHEITSDIPEDGVVKAALKEYQSKIVFTLLSSVCQSLLYQLGWRAEWKKFLMS